MMRVWDDVTLRETLREIGADAPEPSPTLPDEVLARLVDEPVPAPTALVGLRARGLELARWVRARAVRLVALLTALVLGVAVSPVGAQVSEWFDFHGVVVGPERDDSGESDDATPTVPPVRGELTLAEAADLVDFEPYLPAELGEPEQVAVSRDRRLLSMSWGKGAGTVRLDEFDGGLEPRFYKASDDSVPVEIGFREGLWFPTPHHVEVLTGPGQTTRVPPRLAAQTLVWEVDGVTLRLEGRFTISEAEALAESVR